MTEKKKTDKDTLPPLPKVNKRKPPTPPKGKTRNQLPVGVQVQKDGRAVSQGISIEKYNEMAKAYFVEQTALYVVETCNVTPRTAAKYIDRGDPSRGMPAIKTRFQKQLQKTFKQQDESWGDVMKKWAKIFAKGRVIVEERLEKIVPENLSPEKTFEIMSRMMKDESFVLGGPDSRHDLLGDPFEKMTPEELREYVETASLPVKDLPALKKSTGQ